MKITQKILLALIKASFVPQGKNESDEDYEFMDEQNKELGKYLLKCTSPKQIVKVFQKASWDLPSFSSFIKKCSKKDLIPSKLAVELLGEAIKDSDGWDT